MTIKTDDKGRQWDTETVRLDNIEFAALHPEIAGWTPTESDIDFLSQHRPDSSTLYVRDKGGKHE